MPDIAINGVLYAAIYTMKHTAIHEIPYTAIQTFPASTNNGMLNTAI